MTVRLRVKYGALEPNTLYTGSNEAKLVADNIATTDLTGGVSYSALDAYYSGGARWQTPVSLKIDEDGDKFWADRREFPVTGAGTSELTSISTQNVRPADGDQTADMQAIFTAGGDWTVPPGVYQFDSTLLATNKVRLYAPMGATFTTATQRNLIELRAGCNGSEFHGIKFASTFTSSTDTPVSGVIFSQGQSYGDVWFNQCEFTVPNSKHNAVKLMADGLAAFAVSNVRWTYCKFYDIGRMGVETQNHDHDGVLRFLNTEVTNCLFQRTGKLLDSMPAVSLSGGTYGAKVNDNTFDDIGSTNTAQIALEFASDINFSYCQRNRFSRFYLKTAALYLNTPNSSPLNPGAVGLVVTDNVATDGTCRENLYSGISKSYFARNKLVSLGSNKIRGCNDNVFEDEEYTALLAIPPKVPTDSELGLYVVSELAPSVRTTQRNVFRRGVVTAANPNGGMIRFDVAGTSDNRVEGVRFVNSSAGPTQVQERNSAVSNAAVNCLSGATTAFTFSKTVALTDANTNYATNADVLSFDGELIILTGQLTTARTITIPRGTKAIQRFKNLTTRPDAGTPYGVSIAIGSGSGQFTIASGATVAVQINDATATVL